MFKQDKQGIEQVIERYFNASYNGSGQEMLGIFHSEAHIYGMNEHGVLTDWPVSYFAKLVDSDKSPAEVGQPREDEMISIHFTGEKTAAALVKLRIENTRYTDILNFIYIDGRWQVIAKVLSAEKLE